MVAEGRPAEEGGRTQIVRRGPDGDLRPTCCPTAWNVRTAVHEYGGGAWWVRDGVVWFANWADQRLYRLRPAPSRSRSRPEPADPAG